MHNESDESDVMSFLSKLIELTEIRMRNADNEALLKKLVRLKAVMKETETDIRLERYVHGRGMSIEQPDE